MYSPATLDFIDKRDKALVRGDSWDLSFTIHLNGQAQDLTGYSAKCQVRKMADESKVLMEFSTDNGRIPALGSNGELHLTADAADTQLLPKGVHVYDIQLTSPAGAVETVVKGDFQIIADVTK